MEERFPDTHVRGLVATILVDAVQTAVRVATKSWGVSLFPASLLCLNIGKGAVLQLCPNRIVFIATSSQMEGLPRRVRSFFRGNQVYRLIPDAIEGPLADSRLDNCAAFRPAHKDLIERAAQNRKVCFWPRAHSPRVIEYLRGIGCVMPSLETLAENEAGAETNRPAGIPTKPAYRDYGEAPDDNLDDLQRFAARVRKGQP